MPNGHGETDKLRWKLLQNNRSPSFVETKNLTRCPECDMLTYLLVINVSSNTKVFICNWNVQIVPFRVD
jgi:hypothetical protein